MDVSQSLQSSDGRESGLSFKKPASEPSRRNYRRHSPPASSHSLSSSPGGQKHNRSPSAAKHEDEGSKRGRHADVENEKGRGDDRSKRTDAGSRGHHIHNRDNHKHGEHERNYSRRYASYHDRNYHNSRSDYHHYDAGRHPRQSPERFPRDRGTEECAYRRKEGRTFERDRFRDDRNNARSYERESKRQDQDHEKIKDRDSGRCQSGQKQQNDGSGVEAERFRHDKSSDAHKSKVEIDKLKGKESKSERGEGKRIHDEDEYHRSREVSDGKYQVKAAPNLVNDSPSEKIEGTERSDGQGTCKTKDKDKKSWGDRQKGCNTTSDLQQDAGDSKETDIPGTLIRSNSFEACKIVDEKEAQKGSKWGQEGEGSDSTADAEAARVAAMRAAALVNISLGGFKSLDEKRKMLWGSKDQKPAAAVGANVWDTVQFSDRERLEKFHKLMGVKGETVPAAGGSGDNASGLFTSQKQEELQQDLEKQFTAGLRRRDGRTVGLGL